ncbi:MAG: hypothetical protein FK732_03325 [Asgard group archaeon]|nr:hypothetical protein [Asgard group archaeon]
MTEIETEEIISPYLTEEVNLKKRTPFHAQWEIFKIKSWRFLTHHPTCSRYKNHYFSFGPIHVCIGCFSIYSAILTYLVLFLTVPSVFRYNIYVLSILPFVGIFISIYHLIFKVKNKWIKGLFRFIVGFGNSTYAALAIAVFTETSKWWWGIIILVTLFLGNQLYGMSRGKAANRKLCDDCPLSKADPPCRPEGNTNIKIRKVYAIIEEELQLLQEKANKKKESTQEAAVSE